MKLKLNTINYFATFFGIGLLPTFQGTVASIISTILLYNLSSSLHLNIYNHILILLLTFVLSIIIVKTYKYSTGNHDPGEIVIDEVLGVTLFMVVLPILNNPLIYTVLSLIMFRFLDFFKPSIVYRFQIQKSNIAIILDDLMAGAITLILIFPLDFNGIL